MCNLQSTKRRMLVKKNLRKSRIVCSMLLFNSSLSSTFCNPDIDHRQNAMGLLQQYFLGSVSITQHSAVFWVEYCNAQTTIKPICVLAILLSSRHIYLSKINQIYNFANAILKMLYRSDKLFDHLSNISPKIVNSTDWSQSTLVHPISKSFIINA